MRSGQTSGQLTVVFLVALSAACGPPTDILRDGTGNDVPAADISADASRDGFAPDGPDVPLATGQLDLLLMIDNSNSMRDNQTTLSAEVPRLLQALTSQSTPVTSMNVGVLSSDLGTPGSSVPGCLNSDHGDNGLLNPIRNGDAVQQHEPWLTAPPTYGRPADCTMPNQFPSFITFTSGTTSATTFAHDFLCNADLYVNGCGLESQLESIYRALVVNDASDHPGNTGPNAGFLRDRAVLAILVLSDEEDGSVRNCMYPTPGTTGCQDALDVYNAASSAWSSMNLNLRFYFYNPPGGVSDPTWPLERYVDPRDAAGGLLSLKLGHPERIVFGAFTGVPLPGDGPNTQWTDTSGSINWDMLLGAPGSNPDDFNARDSTRAIGGRTPAMTVEGPVSMQQANPDPNCPEREIPACRRRGSAYMSSYCTTDMQYFAWPARRIVEIARRFDTMRFCGGAACRNARVFSICDTSYAPAMQTFAQLIAQRMSGN